MRKISTIYSVPYTYQSQTAPYNPYDGAKVIQLHSDTVVCVEGSFSAPPSVNARFYANVEVCPRADFLDGSFSGEQLFASFRRTSLYTYAVGVTPGYASTKYEKHYIDDSVWGTKNQGYVNQLSTQGTCNSAAVPPTCNITTVDTNIKNACRQAKRFRFVVDLNSVELYLDDVLAGRSEVATKYNEADDIVLIVTIQNAVSSNSLVLGSLYGWDTASSTTFCPDTVIYYAERDFWRNVVGAAEA